MAADRYRNAEDEYFKLRGQFDTGRITQEQFDEKLRELMVQDAQGRYWMLGADSGKWYFYDGAKWVQGEPYAGATPPLASAPIEMPPPVASAPPPRAAVTPTPVTTNNARQFPLVPILILLLLIVLGVAAFLIFQNRERIFVAQQPQQITPVLPATITRAPSPTAPGVVATTVPTQVAIATDIPPTAKPTEIPPTDKPTAIPPTGEPAITVVIVTSEPSPTIELPTLLPTVPPTAVPTRVPTRAPTRIPPTATNVPPTNTPAPNFPPNVYVTKIEHSPNPKRNQNVTFTATFLNTTGGTAHYNWLILLYDPEKQGNNKGFGESPATSVSIPPGESKFSVTYQPVTGPGPCKNLYMRAGWKISAFDKPIFPNTSGDPVTVFFDVCP